MLDKKEQTDADIIYIMTKTPAGITSSVKADGKTFILQTEFRVVDAAKHISDTVLHDYGKIVTTVAIEGQVVHKVDKTYSEPWETEDDFIRAEKNVKDQHLSVARKVTSKPKEFLDAVTAINITPEDKLRLISGVVDVIKIDFNKQNEQTDFRKPNNQFLEHIDKLRDLVIAVSQNTRMGKLQKTVGTIDTKRFMLTGYGGNTYYSKLRDDVDVSFILNELDNIK